MNVHRLSELLDAFRRPAGTPQRRIMLPTVSIAVIALLIALVVTTRDNRPSSPPGDGGPGGGIPSLAQSPSDSPPSQTPASEDATNRVVDRTTRSRAGAVAAAGQYATLLAEMFPVSSAQARAIAADAATSAYRSRLVASVDSQLVPLQEEVSGLGGRTTYRQAVLATRLVSYHDSRASSTSQPSTTAPSNGSSSGRGAWARVSVWTLITVSHVPSGRTDTDATDPTHAGDGAEVPGQGEDGVANAIGSFSTVVLDLSWQRGAWRLAGDTTMRGPAPLIEGTPSSGPELETALRGFRDWRPR